LILTYITIAAAFCFLQDQELKPVQLTNKPAAIVLGRVITEHEVNLIVKQLKKSYPDEVEKNLYWHARRIKASQALLAETAKLHGKGITDKEVIQYYSSMDKISETDVKEDLKYFRESYLVDLYKRCRMGISNRLRVNSDYAPYIRVTPEEMISYYNNTILKAPKEPAKIKLAQYLFPYNTFISKDLLKRFTDECRKRLSKSPKSEKELEGLAKLWEGCIYIPLEIDVNSKSVKPEIMSFARDAKIGDVSQPIDLGLGTAIVFIIDREEIKIPTFDECQKQIYRKIMTAKENYVTERLIMELIEKADYSPYDLFFPSEKSK